jgi:Uma2 family endonuclease
MPQPLLTAEEFMRLPDPPDGARQELIEGRVVTMPPPKGIHGVVCNRLGRLLGNHVDAHGLGWVASNDAGVILEREPDTVRGPDLAYYSKERVPVLPTGYFEVPPDLAVEVLSPDDAASRINSKVRHYLAHGVRLVWVVDPEERTVTVYRSREQIRILEETGMLGGEDVLPGFECPVRELFACLT